MLSSRYLSIFQSRFNGIDLLFYILQVLWQITKVSTDMEKS